MRFIGNKESIVEEIELILEEKGLINKNLTLFDGFTGTGSVSEKLKGKFDIISNDLMKWCVIYTRGRLLRSICSFEKLGFNPIKYFNDSKNVEKGFFYNNYTPGNSSRMYFSEWNGGRIDFFRQKIEQWYIEKLITENEYCYLLACLIESVSLVSNTAGVYGAFLKHWDPRALKEIEFVEVAGINNGKPNNCKFFNSRIEDIIEDVNCDILYIDPPYTQNQYGTQYHLLETLVLYDNPTISKITGSRKTSPMRSDWSKQYKAHILFDKIIAKTKAKYILFSYNVDGFMSKQFIESVLKRYGKEETYVCKEIEYKKYRNWKTKRNNKHFEYLFFIEKDNTENIFYESPLNYVGSKFKYMDQIYKFMPKNIKCFYDIFGGGFNVGININTTSCIVYNDFNWIVKDLIKSFKETETYSYLMQIKRIEKKFELKVDNKENYLNLRSYYNSKSLKERDPKMLFTLILYGFQQQIRFNSNYNFNNPSGNRWFNDNVLEKMISFSRVIKEKNIIFESQDFTFFNENINKEDFVYLDPPYRNTLGSYNDGKRGFKGWDLSHENDLINFIDELNKKGIRFMLSYVIEHKGVINNNILDWINKNNYKVIKLKKVLGRKREEVLIINYEE